MEQLTTAVQQKRVSLSNLAWRPGNTEWMPLNQMPDVLEAIIPPLPNTSVPGASQAPCPLNQEAIHSHLSPPPLPAGNRTKPCRALAITSMILGIFPVIVIGLILAHSTTTPGPFPDTAALGVITVVMLGLWCMPSAIICGHIARRCARRMPAQYGVAGFALSGMVLGYLGIFATLVSCPPAVARARHKNESIICMNNMKRLGLAFLTWAVQNEGDYPFNVSTNKGGTLELCLVGSDGFDRNAAFHFQVMSNELSILEILVCPGDSGKTPALDFLSLRPANVSYRLRSGTSISGTNRQEVPAVCPIHNYVLMCDGSVHAGSKGRR